MSEQDNLNAMMADRLSSIHSDMGELKQDLRESLKDIRDAMNQLVRIEERLSSTTQNYERLVKENDKMKEIYVELEHRLDNIEKDMPQTKQVVKWFMTAVWSAAAAAVYFVAKMTGIV